jgi:putative transposase
VRDAATTMVRRHHPHNTVLHSDQGTRYESSAWRICCGPNHLDPRMSRRGNYCGNGVSASNFGRLKKESIKKRFYTTRKLAVDDLVAYIGSLYNRTR